MDRIQQLDKNNDNYSTPPEVWDNIKHCLPIDDNHIVWEPFFNSDSKSPCHLSTLGCNVLYSNADFFTTRPSCATHIVTNPPFSCKERVFERLYTLDLPFIVIMPVHSLCTRFIKTYFKNKLQIIVPDYRLHFERIDTKTGARKTIKRTPFDSVYVCYKMNLPRDVMWL